MASQSETILITGAGGFIGQALAKALANLPTTKKLILTDITTPSSPVSSSENHSAEVKTLALDLTTPDSASRIITSDLTTIYILHGLMSGASEANLELSLKVNVDSIRLLLDTVRTTLSPSTKVIFPSSLAVYGPPDPSSPTTRETTMPLPNSSYGAQKLMTETLLRDFTRKGAIDARIVRLPTVTVRPGTPTGAASSFASSIFREPLFGKNAVLPVSRSMKLWICSPRTVIKNLVLAKDIPKEKFGENSKIVVNLPGITVSVEEMMAALMRVGGEEAVKLVKEEKDDGIEKIVGSWPYQFDTTYAESMGFVGDGSMEKALWDFIADYGEESEKIKSGAAR